MKLTHYFLRSLAAVAVGISILSPPALDAAGLLIADGGQGGLLEIQEHDVQVNVNNGVAVTQVTQVFRNLEQRQVEALYTFPVPKGASVANFSMWINGKEMVGEVVEKKRAGEIYDSYKQKNRDPGLLEQKDYRTFEMRIFPIAPGANQKVQITYYQELDFDHDWATYVYPLATNTRGKADSRTIGRFAINLNIQSAIPIQALESPSHPSAFVFAKHTANYAEASLETQGGSLAQDVVLACKFQRAKTGIDVLTSARSGEDGFFCVTLTAGDDTPGKDLGADYVFVLDVSGSMANDGKLLLSKDCIGAFLNELNAQDRFELMTFNIQPRLAFNNKRDADESAKKDGLAFLSGATANGGTVLNPALTTAYKYADPDRPLNVVILSDGLTEQRDRRALLELISARPRNAKVFCIGVGNDVDRSLLEQLAADSGGLASFLSPGDDFVRQAKAFRRKLMSPVATDLQLAISGTDVTVSEVEPRQMPNLFHGSPVRVYGRYHGSGPAQLTLRGNLNGVEWKQSADLQLPKEDATNPEIERMWASHKMDTLLKESERKGGRDSVAPEVVRLAENFSIVTEYTSFLVLENDTELQRWRIEKRNAARLARDRQSQAARDITLTKLREKAVADLGPVSVSADSKSQSSPGTADQPATAPKRLTQNAPSSFVPSQSQSRDLSAGNGGKGNGGGGFGGGSGPVGRFLSRSAPGSLGPGKPHANVSPRCNSKSVNA